MERELHGRLLAKAGDRHRYQFAVFVIFALQWALTGAFVTSMGLSLREDPFVCPDEENDAACKQFVCSLPWQEWDKYVMNAKNSIRYSIEPPLVCDRGYIAEIIESSIYVGACLGFLIFPQIADNKGRKPAIIASWVVSSLGAVMVVAINSWPVIVIGMALVGLGTTPGIHIQYTLLGEQTGDWIRPKMMAGLMIFFSVGELMMAGLFWGIGQWKIILGLVLLPPFILVNFGNLIIAQSAEFVAKIDTEQAHFSYAKIATFNNRTCPGLEECKDLGNDSAEETVTFLNLFDYKKIGIATVGSIYGLFCLHLMFYGMEFLLERFGDNVYMNQIIMGCSEMVGYILTPIITSLVYVLNYCLFSMCSVSILAIALAFIRVPQDCNWCALHVVQLFCLIFLRMFLCSFWSSFYLYLMDVYPACKRAMVLGIACFVGFIGSVLSPLLQNLGRPMLLLGILAATFDLYVCLMPRERLEESFDKLLQEQKQQRSIEAQNG